MVDLHKLKESYRAELKLHNEFYLFIRDDLPTWINSETEKFASEDSFRDFLESQYNSTFDMSLSKGYLKPYIEISYKQRKKYYTYVNEDDTLLQDELDINGYQIIVEDLFTENGEVNPESVYRAIVAYGVNLVQKSESLSTMVDSIDKLAIVRNGLLECVELYNSTIDGIGDFDNLKFVIISN